MWIGQLWVSCKFSVIVSQSKRENLIPIQLQMSVTIINEYNIPLQLVHYVISLQRRILISSNTNHPPVYLWGGACQHAKYILVTGQGGEEGGLSIKWGMLSKIIWTHLPRHKNGRHFTDDIFKRIFLNGNVRISIQISLKFVPKGPVDNKSELVSVMAWRRTGDKPLPKPVPVHWRIYAALWADKLNCENTWCTFEIVQFS